MRAKTASNDETVWLIKKLTVVDEAANLKDSAKD
jgi:hypothetical protein